MKKGNPLLAKYVAEHLNNPQLETLSKEQLYRQHVLEAYDGFGFDFHNRAVAGVERIIAELFERIAQKS
jgi:hypothetical protein